MTDKIDEAVNAASETEPTPQDVKAAAEAKGDPSVNQSSDNAPGGQSDTSQAKAEAKAARLAAREKMTKADLLAELEKADEELETMAKAAPSKSMSEPGGDTRHTMRRGSTRRLQRAFEAIDTALKDFSAEVDRQVYQTEPMPEGYDEKTDGPFEPKRTGPCSLVARLEEMRTDIRIYMNHYMTGR